MTVTLEKTTTMTETTDNANAGSQPRFNIDMDVDTTNGSGEDGFVTAAEVNGAREVKRATYVAKMPYVLPTPIRALKHMRARRAVIWSVIRTV